jgi:3-hydroxybutyryl-CoA dehydratase
VTENAARFRTIEDIQIGERASIRREIRREDVEAFAKLSGDYNPLHLDAEYAARTEFERPVAHGMIVASLVSTLVGMHIPGPGALWAEQKFRWRAPVFVGDEVTVELVVVHKSEGARTALIEIKGVNQRGELVVEGKGSAMLPPAGKE